MAFRDSFGGDHHPGRWHPIQRDQERGVDVEFRIRPTDDDIEFDFKKRFGRPVINPLTQLETYELDPAKNDQATKLMAKELWTDTRNAWVYLASQSAAAFYSKELGERHQEGEEVCLDGRLTDGVKWNVLKDDYPLADMILRLARKVQQGADRQREAMRKNSQTSSRATSTGTTPTPSADSVESSEAPAIPASPKAI